MKPPSREGAKIKHAKLEFFRVTFLRMLGLGKIAAENQKRMEPPSCQDQARQAGICQGDIPHEWRARRWTRKC